MAGEEGRLWRSGTGLLQQGAGCKRSTSAPHLSAAKLGQQLRHSDGLLLMQPMCTGPKVPAAACGSGPCCPFFLLCLTLAAELLGS